ncbi:MAG TPA: CsgG/HfaB family protein [Gemmatimonadaceae bacterium]|nr:CsgG/HfaB family protein [Gemmatimonadaceae bacterium]
MDVATIPARSVSVAPFQSTLADTSLAPLGYALADLLLTDLTQSRQLVVVERLRLDAVLRELQMVEAGLVDARSAPRVGRIVGARRLVLGRLAPRPGEQVALDLGVADASTGTMTPIPPAVARLADVLDAEKALAFRLFDQLGVTLSPAERAAIEQRPTRNLAALLAYGRAVRYEVFGDYAAAAREYREAERIDPGFRQAGERRRAAEQLAAPALRSASSLTRAAFATTDRINGVFTTPIGGAARPGLPADPAFQSSSTTIFVTITTPP